MSGLSLLDDIIFRGVFGSQKNGPALAALLSALLHRQGPDKITQVEILNPQRETESLDEKESVLDIKARDGHGSYFNIEVQLTHHIAYRQRTVFYGCSMLTQQPIAGLDYSALCPCIHISLVDFVMFADVESYQHRFVLYNPDSSTQLTNLLEFHYIEIGKFLRALGQPRNTVERWLYFLVNATSAETLADLPEDIRNEEGIAMAYEATNHLLADPELRYRVEARRKFALDVATNLAFAKREGRAEGLAEGRTEGRAEGLTEGRAEGLRDAARKMLSKGMLADAVADITGLDISEVEKLAIPE